MIEIQMTCDVCGRFLDFDVRYKKDIVELVVVPCENCLDSRYEEGLNDGEENIK